MKDSDRYLKIVEWSEIDKYYIGTSPGLLYGGCHGTDETKVYKELCEIVEETIDLYKEDNKPLPRDTAGKIYSGKFLLRTGEELHKALTVRAMQTGESLNNFCSKLLKKAISYSKPQGRLTKKSR